MNSLTIHTSGSHYTTLDALRAMDPPVSMGPRHVPVAHADYVEAIQAAVADLGLDIVRTQIGVARGGLQVFGTIEVAIDGHPDAQIIGFRSGNDKTIALQMVAGARVFVCDNLCFSGDVDTLRRKHTAGVSLLSDVRAGLQRWLGQRVRFQRDLEALRARPVADEEVKIFAVNTALRGIIAGSAITRVWHLWERPPHAAFQPRNAYSLYQAYTEHFKSLSPSRAFRANVELGRMLKLGAAA